MAESEMGAKIQNAFHSIGVEEGFRRGFRRPDLEFRAYTIKWLDGFGDVDSQNKHNRGVENILNDGWWLTDKIVCPPFVMLIFNRERQERQTNNDGSDKENEI